MLHCHRLLGVSLLLITSATGCPPAEPSCPDGEVLDGETCRPAACGVGSWGSLPELEVVAYVSPAGGASGDGTQDAPFDRIRDALDQSAGQAGVIALADGAYSENLRFEAAHEGLELAGRCAGLVMIVAEDDAPAIDVRGGGATIRGVTVCYVAS